VIVTPLMEFVRLRRAAKSAPQVHTQYQKFVLHERALVVHRRYLRPKGVH
jgi:hypothetical protein